MRTTTRLAMAAGLGLTLAAGWSGAWSQEVKGTRPKTTEAAPGSRPAADKPKTRLPNYYGDLELSDEQKTQIYAIQATHREQIEKLEKQLEDLKAARDLEVEGVLTPAQKGKLASLEKKAADKRKEAKEKKEKPTEPTTSSAAPKPPPVPTPTPAKPGK